MAYTIRLLDNLSTFAYEQLTSEFERAIKEDGRFKVSEATHCTVAGYQTIKLHKIRLTQKKSYCGNHPGPCDLANGPARKMNATYLEWDDWVAFHKIVNDTLDSLQVSADVWTMPRDVPGKFWIRKGTSARERFDYEEGFNSYGRPVRVWNKGSQDQFAAEAG
jgi:hypothetical protein